MSVCHALHCFERVTAVDQSKIFKEFNELGSFGLQNAYLHICTIYHHNQDASALYAIVMKLDIPQSQNQFIVAFFAPTSTCHLDLQKLIPAKPVMS